MQETPHKTSLAQWPGNSTTCLSPGKRLSCSFQMQAPSSDTGEMKLEGLASVGATIIYKTEK